MKKILVAFLFLVGLAIALGYENYYKSGTYYAVPIKKADKTLTQNFEIVLENQKLVIENQKAILDGQRKILNF